MALDYGYTIRIQSNGTSDPAHTPTNQWQRKLSGQPEFVDLAGETGATYKVTYSDQSAEIRLKQIFNGSVAYSNSLEVTNASPYPWVGASAIYHIVKPDDNGYVNVAGAGHIKTYNSDGSAVSSLRLTAAGEYFITAKVTNLFLRDSTADWEFGDQTDTSRVTNMSYMFKTSRAFVGRGLEYFNVANLACTSQMFDNCYVFNGNMSNWDVGNVKNMIYTFNNARAFNVDIGGWNTSNVSNMKCMFLNANAFNQNLAGWCVSKIPAKPQSWDANTNFKNQTHLQPKWGQPC